MNRDHILAAALDAVIRGEDAQKRTAEAMRELRTRVEDAVRSNESGGGSAPPMPVEPQPDGSTRFQLAGRWFVLYSDGKLSHG